MDQHGHDGLWILADTCGRQNQLVFKHFWTSCRRSPNSCGTHVETFQIALVMFWASSVKQAMSEILAIDSNGDIAHTGFGVVAVNPVASKQL